MVCRSRRGLVIVHVLNRRHAEEESFADVGVSVGVGSGIGARNKRAMVAKRAAVQAKNHVVSG